MSNARTSTLVVDFSVMPSRPDAAAVEDFVLNKVKLDQADALSIQFHNIRHHLYIQMAGSEKPLQYQRVHNYKHTMLADNKREYKIPVYSEDGAVTVRIHDLPPSIPHTTVQTHMSQYGRVLSVRSEHWRNFFGGIKNGVRVLRMHLNKPIPSYIKIGSEETLVTHSGRQVKTCRFCDQPLHPNTKCGEVAKGQDGAAASQQTTQLSFSAAEFPELASNSVNKNTQETLKQNNPPKEKSDTQQQPEQEQQPHGDDDDDDDDDNGSSSSTDSHALVSTNSKRRLSTAKGNNNKKPCQTSPTGQIENKNCFVLLSPGCGSTERNNNPKM